MKPLGIVLLLVVLLLTASSFAADGYPRGRRPGSTRFSTDRSSWANNALRRGGPTLVWTVGRELAPTPASARWFWVEPLSEEILEQQKSREEAFQKALEQWRKDFYWRVLPGEE